MVAKFPGAELGVDAAASPVGVLVGGGEGGDAAGVGLGVATGAYVAETVTVAVVTFM